MEDGSGIGVILQKQNGVYVIAVKPYRKKVTIGSAVTLTWTAIRPNTSFPDDPVVWKIGNPGVVQKINATTLQLTYTPSEEMVYEYSIAITDESVSPPITVAIDPEVDNERPPMDDEDDKGKGKGKGKDKERP